MTTFHMLKKIFYNNNGKHCVNVSFTLKKQKPWELSAAIRSISYDLPQGILGVSARMWKSGLGVQYSWRENICGRCEVHAEHLQLNPLCLMNSVESTLSVFFLSIWTSINRECVNSPLRFLHTDVNDALHVCIAQHTHTHTVGYVYR